MILPDIILSWPRNTDYPLWRQLIHDNRHRFDRIIVIFTETNHGDDYRGFVMQELAKDEILTYDSPRPENGEDWRDVAITYALQFSKSEWIWFTEQDFFWREGFWEEVEKLSEDNHVSNIQVLDGTRMHPCCLFIRRYILAQTRKYFGIKPDRADHFFAIQEDLLTIGNENGYRTEFLNPDLYYHMAGLSHNMRLLYDGQQPNHDVAEFQNYLVTSLKISLPVDYRFRELAENYLRTVM